MSHQTVATTAQRRAVLRSIDRAEMRMLPPGWDAGLESQLGATLTDPAGKAPTLTLVSNTAAPAETPATDPTAHTQAIHADFNAGDLGEPYVRKDHNLRRRVAIALIAWTVVCAAAFALAIYSTTQRSADRAAPTPVSQQPQKGPSQ
jgi:hypothetical protein